MTKPLTYAWQALSQIAPPRLPYVGTALFEKMLLKALKLAPSVTISAPPKLDSQTVCIMAVEVVRMLSYVVAIGCHSYCVDQLISCCRIFRGHGCVI